LAFGVSLATIRVILEKRPRLNRKTRQLLRQKAGTIVISLVVFGFLFVTILVAWANKDLPDPDQLTDRKVAQSTKIYDRTGEHILYEVYQKKKEP